ncbi:Protein phosphatase 2C 35 [Camellia lanceoleosa]|uniref:Protein phosphatase 2C 35 n=1 Tax=Camellia lanceoleosa TaxID=1840588 RepID=A0ACC0GCB7_9ERIC|nr:Protein phosphatase 2C 35 [Camellia lanceoleosa]
MSSDGLYQYFTNEEAINEVEKFISSFPEGDPAQHLVEEVLFRAAKTADSMMQKAANVWSFSPMEVMTRTAHCIPFCNFIFYIPGLTLVEVRMISISNRFRSQEDGAANTR